MTDKPISVDADFPSGSAGAITLSPAHGFVVLHKAETLPDWFQQKLDTYWGGGGVPKEYMFHVRVRNHTDRTQTASIRFVFSPQGQSYLALPWWIKRGVAWQQLADAEAVLLEADGINRHIDVTVTIAGNKTIYVGSAPYESPEDVDLMTRAVARSSPELRVKEIGTTDQNHPILALESDARPLKLLACATMQACEPTWMGLLHAARAWTSSTPELAELVAQVQLCVVPLSNPDGLTKGYSVTNAAGEVPKFSTHLVCAGEDTPRESRALWDYMDLLRPQIRLEVHAHFTHPGFSRSIGMQEIESMPETVQARAKRIEEAIDSEYHQAGSTTRRVRIDPRVPEEDVYGVREVADAFGVVEIFIQAISDPLKAHNEDVFNCLKTLAGTLIRASAEDLS